MAMRCYLFDIDGTLADISHRLFYIQKEPRDWNAFYDACSDDVPINHIINFALDLKLLNKIVFVSGRTDRVRQKTVRWLQRQCLVNGHYDERNLYMRHDGDHRPDYQVKRELLDRIRADGYEPIMAFDDCDQVVKMWREAGIPCAQVAEGDF